jgi:FkbM family methyltransferase
MENDKKLLNMIDVGCSHYLDDELRVNNKKINFFLGFDPFGKDKNEYIKDVFPNNIVYNYAIFDNEEERQFYICNYERCSSLFVPNVEVVKKMVKRFKNNKKKFHKYDIKDIKVVKCIRLDTIISKLNINFDFIKIDTQGADFNVLKSLGSYLKNDIIAVKIEVFFRPLYNGIVLYKDIDNLLQENDFKCVKEFGSIRKKNKITNKITKDFLYVKNKCNYKEKKIKIIKKIYGVK